MQYMIYHRSGDHLIVTDDDYSQMLDNEEWFKTPSEAKKARETDIENVKKEIECKKESSRKKKENK